MAGWVWTPFARYLAFSPKSLQIWHAGLCATRRRQIYLQSASRPKGKTLPLSWGASSPWGQEQEQERARQSTLVKPQFPSRGLKMLPAPLAPILSRLGPASYPPLASGRCLRERHLKPRHIWGFPVCSGSTYRERSLLGPAELSVREL